MQSVCKIDGISRYPAACELFAYLMKGVLSMKSNHIKSKIGGAILGFALLLGIGVASATNVQAQYRDDQWRQQRQYEREQERERLRRQREYERAQRRQQRQNNGYGYGGYNNGVYNNGGYGNYGNSGYGYGGSYELRQTALNAGYNEGVRAGRNDRSRGRSYNYADEGTYRDATKDYNSRYGDRELYRQYFRQGYVNGYTDGYRGY